MKICILYGGTSRERDVSISSARSMLNALSDNKNIPLAIIINNNRLCADPEMTNPILTALISSLI